MFSFGAGSTTHNHTCIYVSVLTSVSFSLSDLLPSSIGSSLITSVFSGFSLLLSRESRSRDLLRSRERFLSRDRERFDFERFDFFERLELRERRRLSRLRLHNS